MFAKEIARELFYARYLDPEQGERPLYQDYDGHLYVDSRNGGHGWATKFLINTAKVKDQEDNMVEVELEMTVLDDPHGTVTITIENINGKWLLTSRLD